MMFEKTDVLRKIFLEVKIYSWYNFIRECGRCNIVGRLWYYIETK